MYRFIVVIAISLFFIFSIRDSYAQLSGTFTIGSGGDYTSFTSAVSALTSQGVNGSVTFNVLNGNYNEQIIIPSISGTSASNSITFQAQSGSAADVTLFFNTSNNSANYVLRIDAASYLNFNNITLTSDGTSYARVIEILNASHHLTFSNLILNGYEAAGGSTNQSLVFGDGTLNSTLNFDNCEFNEGSSGIYLTGVNTSNLSAGNVIQNCTFSSTGQYGIFLQYQNSPHVLHNTISNSSVNGIYLSSCQNEMQVIGNQVSAITYSLTVYSCTGGNNIDQAPGLIANNFLYASSNYGVYFYTSQYQNFYNNSVNMSSASTSALGLYLYAGGNINIVNNNFVNSGLGLAAQIYSPSGVGTVDYNNYFSNGNYLASWGTTDYYDFASYQAASGKDAHSVSVYPSFTSSTDLHTMTPWLNAKGTPLSEVTDDFDGDTRDGSTPDIGADEFTPDAGDMTPLAGHYTIGGSSPDYASLADAVADLLIKGVSDSVFMDFRNGNYAVYQTMYTFPGTAMDKPVVFQSESANRDNVTLYHYATDANDNYALYLYGADFIHFRNLSFSGNTNTSAYSTNLFLIGGVNGLYLTDCKLTGSTSSSTYAALISGQNSLSMERKFQRNIFNNGGYGIYTSGINNTTSQNYGTIISGNQFNNQGSYVIYIDYENSLLLNDNIINNASNNGIYLSYCNDELQILRNQINAATYGIYLAYSTGGDDLETSPGLIANNIITAYGNYGLYLYSNSYQNIYYNSVNLRTTNTSSLSFYAYAGGNINIVNNNFVNSGLALFTGLSPAWKI